MRPAVPSSVPSPPRTTIMSTWRGSSSLVDHVEPCGRAGRLRQRRGFRHRRRASTCRCFEPRGNLCEVARGPLEARLRHHANGSHFQPRGPSAPLAAARLSCRRWRKNSRLPVSPVIGDSVMAARTNPTSAAARVASSTTRACTAGSRTTPFLPTSARPASNCGLTSATTSAPSRKQRRHSAERCGGAR